MDTLGLLGCFDFDGFPSGGDIATDYPLDAMCLSTSAAPKRSGKLTLTSKTVNSVFFLVSVRVVRRHVAGVSRSHREGVSDRGCTARRLMPDPV